MSDRIRELIATYADLPVEITSLPDNADLYRAGMKSFACVQLMLALEDEFRFEFPEELLTRDTFRSVATIERIVRTLSPDTLAA